MDKWWIAVDEQAKARKRPTSAYGRSAFLIRIKDNLTIEKTGLSLVGVGEWVGGVVVLVG